MRPAGLLLVLVPLGRPAAEESGGGDPAVPDATVLGERAREAARAMPGCFAMRGRAVDRWKAGIFGDGEHRWDLEGRLLDGAWAPLSFAVASDSPDEPDARQHRGSMFGRQASETSDAGRDAFLAALEDRVGVEYVVRSGEGWSLVRTLKGGDALRNTLTVGFDAALRPRSWSIHIEDPVRVRNLGGSQAKIVRMDLRIETDEAGAPRREQLDGVFAQWPFSAELHTLTEWTASPC